jgi:uncharacterized protein DUF6766
MLGTCTRTVTTTLRPRAEQAMAGARTPPPRQSFLRRNALALASFTLFALMVAGMAHAGHRVYNDEQLDHDHAPVSLTTYLAEGHVWEALFENWESEFLQMAAYVLLTVFLIQKGSAESKDPGQHEEVDDDPRDADLRKPVPWPVRRGGFWLLLYENSLLLAFLVLFVASMVGHALGGVDAYNADLREHGQATVDTLGYATSSQFWFESLQNWQSEFLAVFAIVTLSIFLRQRGSPESKPVAASHSKTGTS